MKTFWPDYLLIRILLVILYIWGIFLAFLPAAEIFKIELIDWKKEYTRKPGFFEKSRRNALPDDWKNSREMELFIEERTSGRLIKVSSQLWQGLYAEMNKSDKNRYFKECLGYFPVNFEPFKSLKELLLGQNGRYYLEVSNDKGQKEYLKIDLLDSSEAFQKAPLWLILPHQADGFLLVLGALIVYFIQARGLKNRNVLRYSNALCSRVPDCISALLAAFFIIIGHGITLQIGLQPMSMESLPVYSALGLMLVIISFPLFYTAYYRSFRIEYNDDFIIIRDIFFWQSYRWAEIKRIEEQNWFPPLFMRVFMKIGQIFSRTRSEQKLVTIEEKPGFAIVPQNGQSIILPMGNLFGEEKFFFKCKGHHIEFEDKIIADDRILEEQEELAGISISSSFSCACEIIFMVVVLALIINAQNAPEFKIEAKSFNQQNQNSSDSTLR